MNKEEFLNALRAGLAGLPQADIERSVQYYREMIDDRIEDGMREIDAVADIGDPRELAQAIRQKPTRQTALREHDVMSRAKRIALTACAVVMAVFGVLLVGDGAVHATAMFSGGSGSYKEYTFVQNDISALEIESGAGDVKLYPASDGVCRVQCTNSTAVKYKIWVNSGTLHVERQSRWSLFPISLKEDLVRVYLPEKEYESLWVKSSSGGISVPEALRFRVAIISASSGGIGFSAEVSDELNLHASSGGIAVSGVSPRELIATVSSGGIALSNVDAGSVNLHSSSGGMRLSSMHCGELSAECSSGAMRLEDVIADGKIVLDCTSGSIKLDDCDAAELHIECTSGSVSGHLLTPKIYNASATSGSVRVPSSGSGGICEIRTTSGSIHFD